MFMINSECRDRASVESFPGVMERVELPLTRVYLGPGATPEEGINLEFRLLYEGELKPSGGSNTRSAEKHEIRRAFHPQLRRLWHTHESVRRYAERTGRRIYAQEINDQRIENPSQLSPEDALQKAFAFMEKV